MPLNARTRRLSRPLLDKMLREIAERLKQQVRIVEAINGTNTTNDLHTVIEHQIRTVFGLLLDSHLRGLRDIQGLAEMLYKDERAVA